MSKRRRESESHREEETKPDMGEGALIAALQQREDEITGEANPAPSEKKPEVEARQLQPVPLRVWVASAPEKWDQLFGFERHAKRSKLQPMTVPQWRAEYDKFMNRPV